MVHFSGKLIDIEWLVKGMENLQLQRDKAAVYSVVAECHVFMKTSYCIPAYIC